MKKVTVDLMLGRKSRTHFRKTGPKSMIVAAQMPVATATKSSSYGLRFGKTGLNAGEICDKFNAATKELWEHGILLPIVFFVSPTKSYVMEIQYPTVYALANVLFNMSSKEVVTLDLPKNKETLLRIFYKIATIKSQSLEPETLASWVTQIIGTHLSCDLYNPWRKLKAKFNLKKKR